VIVQEVILQIPHHGVKLCNAVTERRSSGKNHAFAASLFIEITAFEEQIKCFLRSRIGNSGYILQFCGDKEVFELMGFVNEQTVDSELFKCQRIVLIRLFELIKLLLQALTGTLHSLDLELRTFALFQFLNALQNIVNLRLNGHDLSLLRNRNLAELRVTDNNRIIVASGNLSE